MRKLILIALLAVTAGFSQQGPATKKGGGGRAASKAHVLTVAEVDALLAKPEEVLFVDVRRPDEVSSIGGFPVYLSIQLADLEKNSAFIPKDRTIVTVSNHAARGGRAADILAAKGFKVAGTTGADSYTLDGGHNVVKIPVPPPAPAAAATAQK